MMNSIFKKPLCVAFFLWGQCLISPDSLGQSNIFSDTLTWTVSKIIQVDNGQTVDVKTKFISYGTEKIEWIQLDTKKKTFSVVASDIKWVNMESDGIAEFHVESSTINGKIFFKKQGESTYIDFLFFKDDKQALPYRFEINSISK